MEKIIILLDETTIVNFRLLWRLVSRYRSHVMISFIAFLVMFSYFYFSQPLIYSISVPVKTVSKHTVSNDLSALLPVENTTVLTLNELSVSLASYSFLKTYAQMVMSNSNFKKLNLGSVNTGKSYLGSKVSSNCKENIDCMLDRLIPLLRGTFSLEQGQTENRFVLVMSALDERTVTELSHIIIRAIDESRIQFRQYLVVKELDSVSNLIKESRGIIQKENGFSVLEENERTQLIIGDLKERLRILQVSINNELTNTTASEARLAESKKESEVLSTADQLNQVSQISIKNKIRDVRQNIAQLSSIPEDKRSEVDKAVLEKLKFELKQLEASIPNENQVRSYESKSAFSEMQNNKDHNIEFEYMVSKSKITKLQDEYELTKRKIDELSRDKISKDAFVNKLKTDLDFLKNLESKQLSLKLMSSTMTSDLHFEDYGQDAKEFRVSSLFKIFIFSFMMTLFMYFTSILVRYVADDRIYSEDDLKAHFSKLDFIGEVPAFDG